MIGTAKLKGCIVFAAALHGSSAWSVNEKVTCLTTTPYTMSEASMAGVRRFEKFKSTQKKVGSYKSFLDAVFSKGVGIRVNDGINAVVPEAAEHLRWTREKGALVEVLMQRDKVDFAPAELLGVSFLGGGSCPYNVLLEHLSKDRIGPAPRDGYRIDNDESLFLWVTLNDGKVTTSTVAPGSRGPVMAKLVGDSEAQKVVRSHAVARELEQLRGLVREIERMTNSAIVKKQVRLAVEGIEEALQERRNIDLELQRALKEQESIANARAWIDSLQTVLAIAQLGLQVSSMLSDAPLETREGVKSSKSASDMRNVISAYELSVTDRKTQVLKDQTVIQERTIQYRETVLQNATALGAPSTATKLP